MQLPVLNTEKMQLPVLNTVSQPTIGSYIHAENTINLCLVNYPYNAKSQ